MKKFLPIFLVALSLILMALPAKAETSFSFTVNSGHAGQHWNRGRAHARVHHRPRYRPVFYAPRPIFVQPPVIYTQPRTVVFQTVAPAQPILANPTSMPYNDESGRLCREYQSTGLVGGAQRVLYGTACRQPDGSWSVAE